MARKIDDELREMLKEEHSTVVKESDEPSTLMGRWFQEADDDDDEDEGESLEDIEKDMDNIDDDDDSDDDDKKDDDEDEDDDIGKDDSDVQNEYDPKEVTILMKLMASEADAMNEYMDGAKETNVDVLRRLYADIANEERFHMEQLLYAKCELTGEKYVPKDPEVKSEYEELLKMGMDEDTAMQTAVDRCHIRGSISFEDDVDDMKSIQADFETMESALMMFGALYDSTEYILESSSSTEDVERAINTFVEAFVVSEAVYDATAATSVKSPLSTANKRGPIMLLADAIRFLGKAIVTMVRKFVEFTKRVSNHSREISNFIKQNGLGAIFDKKVSFYFINLKFPTAAYIDQHLFSLLALSYDTLAACAASLNMPFQNDFMPTDITRKRDPQLKIGGNMMRGAELLQGVQLIKTPFVLPKDTDMQEQMRIAHALFGMTGLYGDDGKSINTLNSLKIVCDSWSHMMQAAQKLIDETGKLQQNPQSLYYKNRKKFDQTVKCMEAVVKTCKAWVTAMQSDISTIIKLDNTAMIAATENVENASKSINPRQRAQSDMYEQTIRTPESAGKPKKVNRFSGR
jgi:rubrerythrin